MNTPNASKLVACLVAILPAAIPAAAAAASVRVTVTGMKSATGEVSCALYRSAAGFPSKPERAVLRVAAPIKAGLALCVFDDVPQGPAAVSVFHDANDNKKLDLRFGVIPREGLGASNNPKVRFGPPKYEAARFLVGDTPVAMTVRLQHP